MRRKPRLLSSSEVSWLACSVPVRTSTVRGSDGAQPVAQIVGRHAWLAGDVDLVEGAPLADDALGLGQA